MVTNHKESLNMSVHQAQLSLLRETLKAKKTMPFSEFMQQALYHPSLGYYSAKENPIGKKGDFVTAPVISSLFAKTLATQIKATFATIKSPNLLEFGAGTGDLALELLLALEKDNALPEHYYILDVSSNLKAKQYQTLKEGAPHLIEKVVFLTELPQDFSGVILANEVIDAFSIQRFMVDDNGLYEIGLGLNEKDEIAEVLLAPDETLSKFIKGLSNLNTPYCSEYNPHVYPWIKSLSQSLKKGLIFLIDYGYSRKTYYHPSRQMGTLMCHHQQKANINPYLHIGEQDITSHVDFTLVAQAATDANLSVLGFCNQASFLLAAGLLDFIKDLANDENHYQYTQAIKLLTHPEEMGESFKVMALAKDCDIDLSGFAMQDLLPTL